MNADTNSGHAGVLVIGYPHPRSTEAFHDVLGAIVEN